MPVNIQQIVDLKGKLKEYFGYDKFRGNQEDIIKNLLSGNDTFVIMPTGAGKSMCYQLPAIVQEGVAIVISPLIALMKNQVDQMNAFGINAQFLNSTLSKGEINKVKKGTLSGDIKLLYVAPESLTKQENISFLREANISFVAIDEAHCISEWGHDFRPEYRRIRSIIDELGNKPIIALTATATPKVQIDIQKNLRMDDAKVFKSSFNRENLYYEVRPKTGVKKHLIKLIKAMKGQSGIIYCLSRKKVEEIAEFLQVNDINALPYHAGLDAQVRMNNQDAFLKENAGVIVATIAFGMGIDKPDVRFVIHYDAPKSLEGYYQETGRAGRDGLDGKCVMFYSYKDILKLEKFNKDKTVTERDNARHLLDEVAAYSESSVCRRKQILHYFGDTHQEDTCQNGCDNCKHPRESYQSIAEVKIALETVQQTGERFGATHLANVIRGSENQYVKSYGHDGLEVYGKGKSRKVEEWASIIRQTMYHGFLYKDIDNYGVLKLTPEGEEYITTPYEVVLTKDFDYSKHDDNEDADIIDSSVPKTYDKVLLAQLKELRKKEGAKKGLPPYVLFQDPSLIEMATVFPTNHEELIHIQGVGQGKATKFGRPFTTLIKKYVEENGIVPEADMFVKSSANKSKNKILIIQSIDRQVDLDEIASSSGMDMMKLIEEIEHICYSGTKLALDYYIEAFMDEEKQDDIIDYFMTADTDDIDEALNEFEDEYSEEELRLVRIKFLSEVAN